MAQASPQKQNTVLWWIGWIVLTIVSFFVSCYFWTGFIGRHVGSIHEGGVSVLWVAAVFGSWMVLLVPLIVVMYNKVDRTYEDARLSREANELKKAKNEFGVRSVLIPEENRLIPQNLTEKLKKVPRAIKRGHLVTAVLKSGKRVDHVFILDKKEVLGIYNAQSLPFQMGDLVDLEPSDLDKLPPFETKKWLRLDGAGTPIGS